MQSLKIEIPKGFEIASFDKLSGEIRFKETPKSVFDRIKSVDDVMTANGLTREQFDESCQGLSPDEVAYRILKLLAKSLNEGWLPDWSNSSEYKYYPWFEMRGSSGFRFYDYAYWSSISLVGSRLCFKSSKLAEHAAKHFLSVYQDFMVIQ